MTQEGSLCIGDQLVINTPGAWAEDAPVASNAASIDLGIPGRVYRITINSTDAFTLTVNNLAITPLWANADIFIHTVAVPSSFTFAGIATGAQVTGRTLAANPFATGSISRVRLMKQTEGRYLIEFDPAMVPHT